MKKVVELDQFRRKEQQAKPEASLAAQPSKPASAGPTPERDPSATSPKTDVGGKDKPQKLTKPAQDFRRRFEKALNELKTEALEELAKAKTKEEFKKKINVSLVLKRAKSSPLTAYSPLHRDVLIPMVQQVSEELHEASAIRFATQTKNKSTASNLRQELQEAKRSFETQLSALASQKMSSYIQGRPQ